MKGRVGVTGTHTDTHTGPVRGVPEVADVRQQHDEMGQPSRLLLKAQASLSDDPDQRVGQRVQEAKQFVPAPQHALAVRRDQVHVCENTHTRTHTHTHKQPNTNPHAHK